MSGSCSRFTFAIALLLVHGTGVAQTARRTAESAAAPKKLVAIQVKGTTHFSRDEIVAAAGLKIGDPVTDEDFKRASERLGKTGMFSDVGYAFSYSALGTKLELQVTDSTKFVPVRFENFVWFTDEDLGTELKSRVPLFRGEVPVAGSLLEQLNDALQALLLEKKLPGRVDYLRTGPQDGGEIIAINFTVNDVKITIQDVKFPGAGPGEETALIDASKKLLGDEYSRDHVLMYGQHEWLPIYLQRGYLRASFKDPQPRVVRQEGTTTEVDLLVPVEPGAVFRVESVAWSGNKVLALESLDSMIHLPMGEPANAMRLRGDLETAEKSYGAKGYMKAKITPEAGLDEAKSVVRYTFHVEEGEQYHMGELEIQGLDAAAMARVQGAWSLREGEPYDAGYAKRFLNDAVKVLPTNVQWSVDTRESVNVEDKTVDVNLRFQAK
jgi:outer membrane protein assembly factor BamA